MHVKPLRENGQARDGNLMRRAIAFVLLVELALIMATGLSAEEPSRQERVRDRLWLWTHPTGSYNNDFIKNRSKKSTVEPVDATREMGLRNAYFIRYKDVPKLPFDSYYTPFKKLERVTWSLTGASGVTSVKEREHVFKLAEKNKNITSFIMDDFFHPAAHVPLHWLAENDVKFPVTLTLQSDQPTVADHLRLVQSQWYTKDYRSKAFAVDVSADGKSYRQVAVGEFPNKPGATQDVSLPKEPFNSIRIRILSTHDSEQSATSCGLKQIELELGDQRIATEKWAVKASSEYPGHPAQNILANADSVPMRASLTPEQLRELRKRLLIGGRRIPLQVVVYSHAIIARAVHHLRHVDAITLWTWDPNEIKNLEPTLERLEKLAPDKEIILGCYMFDFGKRKPLPVHLMKQQTELGYQWLLQGRIKGMIFLASPICDIDLKSVEWTRQWIRRVGDQVLPAVKP
ncbi:MAG: hypothetical protein ABGX16_23300 [Pirellulales bacterium]